MSQNNIINLISDWNSRYPYDFLWRRKYNIPFGSPKHMEMNHIDMVMDLAEEVYIKKLIEERDEQEMLGGRFDEQSINMLNFDPQTEEKKVVKMNKSEVDEEFANMNLNDFDDK